MHFTISHDFDIPLDALELAVISPSLVDKFGTQVNKLGVGIEKVTERARSLKNGILERTWRYQANVKIPKFAQGTVTREMCAWDEHSSYEMARHEGKWSIVPNVKPEWRRFFSASGTYVIEPLGDGRSRRIAEGSLELRVRVVRQVAERLIVNEVRKAFDVEAATLRDMATLI